MVAAQNGHFIVVEALLQHAASVDKTDNMNAVSVFYAFGISLHFVWI